MNNKPPVLKNQETTKDRNKMRHLNLLPDQDVYAIFIQKKGKEMSKDCFQNLLVFKSQYLKQQGSH